MVRDRHGVCSYCHENAHQCRQCRNINYECLDGFLCNECGHSRFGRLDMSVTAAPCSEYPAPESDEDVARMLAALDVEADALHRVQEEHAALREPLAAALVACGHRVGLGGDATAGSSSGSTRGTGGGGGSRRGGESLLPSAAPVAPAKGVSRGVAMLGVLYGVKCKAAYQATATSLHTLASMQRR